MRLSAAATLTDSQSVGLGGLRQILGRALRLGQAKGPSAAATLIKLIK